MSQTNYSFPNHETLMTGLTSVLGGNGSAGSGLSILEREHNEYASSRAPSEIVKCRLSDGSEKILFCKYENVNRQPRIYLDYEANVYRRVVVPSGLPSPNFYGSYFDANEQRTWMILEYMSDSMLLSELREAEAMQLAARWLGQFHASQEQRAANPELAFLKVMDAEYYFQWVRRALEYAPLSAENFSWLTPLCRRFEELARPLMSIRPVIAHGDYYLHNVLWRDGDIYPIDWELAGIDLGEMDLACLTDGWKGETARNCEQEYQTARWPEGAPDDFQLMLAVARLCLCFYNLGTRPDWSTDTQGLWYSRKLRALGEKLALI